MDFRLNCWIGTILAFCRAQGPGNGLLHRTSILILEFWLMLA
jgi:hypothetical protein